MNISLALSISQIEYFHTIKVFVADLKFKFKMVFCLASLVRAKNSEEEGKISELRVRTGEDATGPGRTVTPCAMGSLRSTTTVLAHSKQVCEEPAGLEVSFLDLDKLGFHTDSATNRSVTSTAPLSVLLSPRYTTVVRKATVPPILLCVCTWSGSGPLSAFRMDSLVLGRKAAGARGGREGGCYGSSTWVMTVIMGERVAGP